MLNAAIKTRGLPHVIVVGNEKGGSGKTTIAAHIVMALLKSGQRVASIDLDGRQRTLTHYFENRRGWARRRHMELELPTHFTIARAETAAVADGEAAEFAAFEQAIGGSEQRHDFLVIDTPPHDSYLMRLAHSIADTLVTPLNDSFLDVDVLARLDPVTLAPTGASHYAELVREMRHHRRTISHEPMDWVVVTNRLSQVGSSGRPALWDCLQELALDVGFRLTAGFHERAIYRDLFPRGLSVLDPLENAAPPSDPLLPAARQEVATLLDILKLPIDARGRRRAAARLEWSAAQDKPLEMDDLLADLSS
jgi:chromosome partitioning protein